jgi:hypothetical protein
MILFFARYDWTSKGIWSHALQRIIFGELNREQPLTYEKALTHEQNM